MFLKMEYDLLKCEGLNSGEKLIIAFFLGYQQSKLKFFGGAPYLAKLFGSTVGQVEKVLESLEKKGIIENNIYEIALNLDLRQIITKFSYLEREV